MIFDKKLIGYFTTVLTTAGAYIAWNLSEQRKITKRMNRHESFLAESEEYLKKYTGPDLNKPEAIAEYQDIMDRYKI